MTKRNETQNLLQIIPVIVQIIKPNRFLTKSDNINCFTEYDFIVQMWAPLLKSLVDVYDICKWGPENHIQSMVSLLGSAHTAKLVLDLKWIFDCCIVLSKKNTIYLP